MSAAGPLAGIFIVDLTRVLAGPYCTMVLADLGARVVKVEAPQGDDARRIGPFVGGVSAYYASLNRGKQSIALDLKDDADRRVFDALVARADVLVENFRPGVMARLGYGWEALHARHPRLVMASVSGFGQTGPYASRPAYDVVVQAMGGIMSLTGEVGGGPVRVGTSLGDIGAGLFAAVGIQAALVERARTGEGRHLDVGMLDCQVAMLENAIARYHATGEVPGPLGTRHPSITPFQAFRAKDGHLVLAAGNTAMFEKLCDGIGCPELAQDERFETNRSRTENAAALTQAIERVLAKWSVAEALERLDAAGIPCGPLNDVAAVLDDDHVKARNMLVSVDDPEAGRLTLSGNPMKFAGVEDPASRVPAPALDADREALLAELGLA